MKKLPQDPLFIFALLGVIMFAIAQWRDADGSATTINVTAPDIKRLQDQWAVQMRRPATSGELEGLIDQFVREEIYYREARNLGLDENDTIVRRRMVQKLTFLTEDLATVLQPDDAVLREYYAERSEAYAIPETFSFKHVYFSADRRKDAHSDAIAAKKEADAIAAKKEADVIAAKKKADAITAKNITAPVGDTFMLQPEYGRKTQRDIANIFGKGFAETLRSLEPDPAWQGPVESAYGWHLVQMVDRAPYQKQTFATVRDRVALDWQQAKRKAANADYYANLLNKYKIHRPSMANPDKAQVP